MIKRIIVASVSILAIVGYASTMRADSPRKLFYEYSPPSNKDVESLIVECEPGHIRITPANTKMVLVWCSGD